MYISTFSVNYIPHQPPPSTRHTPQCFRPATEHLGPSPGSRYALQQCDKTPLHCATSSWPVMKLFNTPLSTLAQYVGAQCIRAARHEIDGKCQIASSTVHVLAAIQQAVHSHLISKKIRTRNVHAEIVLRMYLTASFSDSS